MASKDFSNRLKDLRLKAGYSQKDVYEHFKIPQSTFSSWEIGKSEPSGEMLIKLCEYYHCDMIKEFSSSEDLTYKEWDLIEKYRYITEHSPEGASVIDMVLDREHSLAKQSIKQKEHIEELEKVALQGGTHNSNIRLINYYYRLASAGTGQIVFDMPPTKQIQIPNIPKYKNVSYAIGVNGNSMEPIFSDGDTLLVEMADEIPINEIGIFLVDGESYVKKLGNKELISLNPNYKNVPLTENSRCMGRVVDKLIL